MRNVNTETLPIVLATTSVVVICGVNRLGVVIVRGKAFSTHHGRHTSVPAPSDDQKALLDAFRTKVESRITSHGLTAADVQTFLDEIKK